MKEYLDKEQVLQIIERVIINCHQMAIAPVTGLKYSIDAMDCVTFDSFTPREKVIFEVAMEHESTVMEEREQESRIDTNYEKSCRDVIEKIKNSPFWL